MYGKAPANSLANRPSSRAGATSSWGRQGTSGQEGPGVPPRTGIMPPGTASHRSYGIPGTAMRPGTGMRGAGFNIQDRPVTQQGIGGMRVATPSTSYGRVVRDKTFFMAELRQKAGLLNAEMARLHSEHEKLAKENANLAAFEKKADTMAEELKELQGQLGDYNTLVDKINTNNDLEEVEKQLQQLKGKNQRESHILDDVFIQRQQKEATVKEIEKLIQVEQQKVEAQIEELSIEKRKEYNQLKISFAQYASEITRQQDEIGQLKEKVAKYQNELKNNPLKQKAALLQERLTEARNRKQDLETALSLIDSESAVQEKQRLLDQVKEDNLEISGMERRIRELEETKQKLRDQILQIEAEAESGSAEKNAKYEELLRRDKEMTLFLESFEMRKAEAVSRNQCTEAIIVELLASIRNLNKAEGARLPSTDGYKELKCDLAVKEKEVKNSEMTMDAILIERERRMQDLDKVNQLESKLSIELDHLRARIKAMEEDLVKFEDIDSYKKEAEKSKEKYFGERELLQYQRDSLRCQVEILTEKHEAKRKQLNDTETYHLLNGLEQKLRHHESNNFHLREYIQSKTAESDYKPLSAEVQKLMTEVHGQLIKMMSLTPSR